MAQKKVLTENGLIYLWSLIKTHVSNAVSGKVDKVDGKGLSTNDYTTTEKNKLAGIASGANKTTVDSALSDSSANPVQNKIVKAELDKKVNAVSGKGLSTNDYTTTEKNKLSGIEAGANKTVVDSELSETSANPVQNKTIYVKIQEIIADFTEKLGLKADKTSLESHTGNATVHITSAERTKWDSAKTHADSAHAPSNAQANVIESIKVNGTAQTVSSKAVNITVPTNNNQLTNGAGYQTSAQVQSLINSSIGQITGVEFQVVSSLPATGQAGVFYLIAHTHGDKDIYDEYVWISSTSKFEKIGTTDIDLSGYMLSADLVEISNAEIDTICV